MRKTYRLVAYGLTVLTVTAVFGHLLPGCTSAIPYRTGGLVADPECEAVYADYSGRELGENPFEGSGIDHKCWLRSIEEHPTYDLLVAEFSDQGWVQGSASADRPGEDYLDAFFEKLSERHAMWQKDGRGVSLVVYVHGWHHNAMGHNPNMMDFRRLLSSMAWMEAYVTPRGQRHRRVVGVYVGWRGESIDLPGLRYLTFFDRMTTADRVSQGSVRELLKRLDLFRDSSRDANCERDVRMLTIGHSFGGLITYTTLGGEFVRNAVRFKETRSDGGIDKYMSRVGDLVVLVNPAFEGARYEPLHTASQRLRQIEPSQLPVLVVATSEGDWATGTLFPMARHISTFLEDKKAHEGGAVVKAVGHNSRYTTHTLALCTANDEKCRQACQVPGRSAAQKTDVSLDALATEYQYMANVARSGAATTQYFCGGLKLEATNQWYPKDNPYWVVRTSEAVIGGHNDVFNPNFIAFVRQLYLSLIYAREHMADKSQERRACRPSG